MSKKRLISLLLCVCMILSFMVFTGAAEPETEAQETTEEKLQSVAETLTDCLEQERPDDAAAILDTLAEPQEGAQEESAGIPDDVQLPELTEEDLQTPLTEIITEKQAEKLDELQSGEDGEVPPVEEMTVQDELNALNDAAKEGDMETVGEAAEILAEGEPGLLEKLADGFMKLMSLGAALPEEELNEPDEGTFYLTYTGDDGVVYRSFQSNGVHYLYLPYGTPTDSLIVKCSRRPTDASGYEILVNKKIDAGVGTFTITDQNSNTYNVSISVSDVPSVSVALNGVSLSTVHSDKEVKYEGQSVTITGDGYDPIVDTDMTFKGRGNFSWSLDKRPYQIKLSTKEDVLGMGKSKMWILLANHGDASLMRNALALEVADEIGMPYASQWRCADLWIDGEYRGSYILCEKVQVGSNRVELEDANGLLVELDNNYYAAEDDYFTASQSGTHFVLKDSVADDAGTPDSVSEAAFGSFASYINSFEAALYAQHPDWSVISSMIDVESFIQFFFVQEFTENADGMRSSVYLYKDGDSDVLHMGPAWDYDLALGNCYTEKDGGLTNIDYIQNAKDYEPNYSCDWYKKLFSIPEFYDAVLTYYNDNVKPVLDDTQNMISEVEDLADNSAEMNFNRWHILGGENLFGSYRGHNYKSTYEGEVDYLSDWVADRVAYLNKRYAPLPEIANTLTLIDAFERDWTKNNPTQVDVPIYFTDIEGNPLTGRDLIHQVGPDNVYPHEDDYYSFGYNGSRIHDLIPILGLGTLADDGQDYALDHVEISQNNGASWTRLSTTASTDYIWCQNSAQPNYFEDYGWRVGHGSTKYADFTAAVAPVQFKFVYKPTYMLTLVDGYQEENPQDWKLYNGRQTTIHVPICFEDTSGNAMAGDNYTFTIQPGENTDVVYNFTTAYTQPAVVDMLGLRTLVAADGSVYTLTSVQISSNGGSSWGNFQNGNNLYCNGSGQTDGTKWRDTYGWRLNDTDVFDDSHSNQLKFIYKPVFLGDKHTIPSVENNTSGIKMRLFNYNGAINNYGVQDRFQFRNSGEGLDGKGTFGSVSINTKCDADGFTADDEHGYHATVEHNLGADGYPVFDARGQGTNFSLGYLFGAATGPNGNTVEGAVTAYNPDTTMLLHNEKTGEYYYDANKNAADYDPFNNLMRVRDYTEQNSYYASFDQSWGYRAFLPFNTWDGMSYAGHDNGVDYQYTTAQTDFFFGYSLEYEFLMPKDGLLDSGKPMEFKFSGDDDVFVFIDDTLVLDMGGTHGTVDGTINFATGEVVTELTWPQSEFRPKNETTLKAQYDAAGTTSNVEWNRDTFEDYSVHTLKMYYLERGGGASNCKLNFNLPVMPSGDLSVTKRVDGAGVGVDATADLSYQFRLLDDEGAAMPNVPYVVIIADTAEKVGEGKTDGDGMFSLMADQTVTFQFEYGLGEEEQKCYVQEVITQDVAPYVTKTTYSLNGGAEAEDRKTGEIDIQPGEKQRVVFNNTLTAQTCLVIRKTGCDEQLDPNQSFLFTVVGTDALTNQVNMTVSVIGNGSATICALPFGSYTITEQTGWSWRYTPEDSEQEITLGSDPEDNVVTFENERSDIYWLDGNAAAKNVFAAYTAPENE